MITAKFAFYWEMGEPQASYLIIKSDNPNFPVYGNKGAEDLKQAGLEVPSTPTYQEWISNGKPVYRGEGDIR